MQSKLSSKRKSPPNKGAQLQTDQHHDGEGYFVAVVGAGDALYNYIMQYTICQRHWILLCSADSENFLWLISYNYTLVILKKGGGERGEGSRPSS